MPFVGLAKKSNTSGLRPYVWVLDAGHGGHDVGTKMNGYYEKNINLRIVKELQTLLQKNKPGIKLVLTRQDDRFLSLEERCNIANRNKADLFVSVHVNFAPNNAFLQGTETFYANPKAVHSSVQKSTIARNIDRSELVAWLMQHQYRQGGRVADRGAKRSNYYVCLNTNMPSVLTEVGFMSNKTEEQYMKSDLGIKQLATCIYNALAEYHAVLQAGSQKKTLNLLRATGGKDSGVKAKLLPLPQSSGVTNNAAVPAPAQINPQDNRVESPVVHQTIQTHYAEDENPAIAYIDATLNGIEESVVEPVTEIVSNEGRIASPDEQIQAKTPTLKGEDGMLSTPEDKSNNPSPSREAGERSAVSFSVQLFAISSQLSPTDPRLKGVSPVSFVQVGAVYKVLYGSTTNYQEARTILTTIRQKFPDAFLVAYRDGKQIPVAEAIK